MLFGRVDWATMEESVNGVIVFDGSVWSPEELGLLKELIELYVENDRVVRIEGWLEGRVFI